MKPQTPDLYDSVTQQIITAIEDGTATHSMPWHSISGLPKNLASDRAYRGINTLLLWLIGNQRGYRTPYWATFRQWLELGHPVRKGEKSATVVFWKDLRGFGQADAVSADGDSESRPRFVARAYHVFNAAQVEDYIVPDMPVLGEAERDQAAEAFFASLPLSVTHGGSSAFYRPSTDEICLPAYADFRSANAYYATRGHESVHATGAKTRLDRDLTGRFGSESYAVEELIAELGAAFLCADLALAPELRNDHAGYVESWLKVLKGDKRAIFTAAAKAQQAVDWLHSNRGEQ